MLEVILRDPNSEVGQPPPILAFSLSLSSVYLFVGDRRWKEVVKWASGAVRDLGRVKGFLCSGRSETGWLNCRRLPTPFDWFSLLLPFACLHFLPLLVFPAFSFIVCLSINPLSFTRSSSNYIPFFSRSLTFSHVDFSHCPLFPSILVLLSIARFLCHSRWMFLVASCSVSLSSYAVTDVLPTQKAPLLGLMPARLAPLFWWTPGGFRFTSDRIPLF